jgi:hypothetical protein
VKTPSKYNSLRILANGFLIIKTGLRRKGIRTCDTYHSLSTRYVFPWVRGPLVSRLARESRPAVNYSAYQRVTCELCSIGFASFKVSVQAFCITIFRSATLSPGMQFSLPTAIRGLLKRPHGAYFPQADLLGLIPAAPRRDAD